MPDRVTVMIVDDQAPFRAAARAVVDRIDGFELVAEVESGEEAVAASARHEPDLVLMDINMGELDGIAATRLITAAAPDTKVILVSTYQLEDLPPDARASGAVGYVNKDELSPRLVRRMWEDGGDLAWRPSIGERRRLDPRNAQSRSISRRGERAGHGRALPRLRSHGHGAAEGAETVGHVDEAVAGAGRRRRRRSRHRRR